MTQVIVCTVKPTLEWAFSCGTYSYFVPKADMSAVAVWELYQQQNFLPLHKCSSAHELKQRGFNQDVELSLEVDSTELGGQLPNDFYASYLS